MTEKELFRNALKENMDDPAELSAAEVRESRKKYGYVRSKLPVYAAAASLVIAVGAGVFFAVRGGSDINKDPAASSAKEADSIVQTTTSSETEPASTAKTETAENEEEKAMKLYHDFWNEVANSPGNYFTGVEIMKDTFTEGGNSGKEIAYTEDQFATPRSGKNMSEELAQFFKNAGQVEYAGYFSSDPDDKGSISLVETVKTDSNSIKVDYIHLSPRAGVDTEGQDVYYAGYQLGESCAAVMLTAKDTAGSGEMIYKNYYYNVTSPDGKYPCTEADGRTFSVPDWNICTSNNHLLLSKESLQQFDGSEFFYITGPDEQISYKVTPDFVSGKLPKFGITGMFMNNGAKVTEGEFRIHIDTVDQYGKNSVIDHPVAMDESFCEHGKMFVVDLDNYAAQLDKKDIVSFRVDAHFNTDEHTAAYNEFSGQKEYAYNIASYFGIDRRTAADPAQ
ncbi:MAG: hypothetical protein IKO27_01030 [Ruminococcus sp.]|nr:hypothetical protein [Ruminococcus sp.]